MNHYFRACIDVGLCIVAATVTRFVFGAFGNDIPEDEFRYCVVLLVLVLVIERQRRNESERFR